MNPKKKRKDREVHKSDESIQIPVKIIKRETQMRKKKEETGLYAYTNTSTTYQTGNPNERKKRKKKKKKKKNLAIGPLRLYKNK
jgi:hypothetical protein